MRYPTLALAAVALTGAALFTPAAAQRPTAPSRMDWPGGDRAAIGVTLASDENDSLGVRVAEVTPDGPAAKAGITAGSRITSINGVDLRLAPADVADPAMRGVAARRLTRELGKVKAGDEVELRVATDGQTRTVKVRTVKAEELNGGRMLGRRRARDENRATLGLSVRATGSVRDTLGVFVQAVAPDGPAERAGIVEGARIAAVNGVDLRVSRADVEDRMVGRAKASRLGRELEQVKPGEEVELRVWVNGQYRTTKVRTARAGDVYEEGEWGAGMFEPLFEYAPTPRVRVLPGTPPRPPRTRLIVPDGEIRIRADAGPLEEHEARALLVPELRHRAEVLREEARAAARRAAVMRASRMIWL
jgi:predicted metalloprotease with PDZ domain